MRSEALVYNFRLCQKCFSRLLHQFTTGYEYIYNCFMLFATHMCSVFVVRAATTMGNNFLINVSATNYKWQRPTSCCPVERLRIRHRLLLKLKKIYIQYIIVCICTATDHWIHASLLKFAVRHFMETVPLYELIQLQSFS